MLPHPPFVLLFCATYGRKVTHLEREIQLKGCTGLCFSVFLEKNVKNISKNLRVI